MKPIKPTRLEAMAEPCATPADALAPARDSVGHANDLIMPLHGLRGIAACTVLVGHLLPISSAPSLGVVLFFLLSGFLMGRLYLSRPFGRQEVVDYAFARMGRIYPLFALVILVAGAFSLTAMPPPFDLQPDEIVRHLLLAGDAMTVWTISVEVQFYALFVILWFVGSRIRPERHGLWIGLTLAVTSVIAVAIQPDAGRIDLLRYLHLFIGGLLLSVLLRDPPGERVQQMAAASLPRLLVAFVLAFLLVPRFYDHELIYADLLSASICAAIISCAVAAPASAAASWLSSRTLVWLGELSFGIYLFHRIAQTFVYAALPDLHFAGQIVVMLLLTFAAAQLANSLLENPARKKVRQWGRRLAG